MAKPILSLKKKNPEFEAPEMILEEIPVNPLAAIEVVIWD